MRSLNRFQYGTSVAVEPNVRPSLKCASPRGTQRNRSIRCAVVCVYTDANWGDPPNWIIILFLVREPVVAAMDTTPAEEEATHMDLC
jgi:hypothetical protein